MLSSSVDGRVVGVVSLIKCLQGQLARKIILGEDIVDAGKVDLPLAGVDFRYSSQRGFAVVFCCHFTRTR